MSTFETIIVQDSEVACDGGKGTDGHPRVFLHIDKNTNQIVCPYCSRLYLLEDAADRKVG